MTKQTHAQSGVKCEECSDHEYRSGTDTTSTTIQTELKTFTFDVLKITYFGRYFNLSAALPLL